MTRRITLVLALVAMLVVSALPAVAEISQEFSGRRITSGAASPKVAISNSGNNVNLCPTTQQVVNTGNVANEQGVTQYFTSTDDIDFTGSEISITPSVTATCDQALRQAAAAG